jgi:hypothetical protein
MKGMVTFPQIEEILEVLDEHGINRELIEIPLGTRDPGGIQDLGGGKCRVTVPESVDFADWLDGVRAPLLAFYGVTE